MAKLTEERGDLVGAMIVSETDEALIVMERGKVVRSSVSGVPAKGRDTMGVVFAKPDKNDRIIAVAKNTETAELEDDEEDGDTPVAVDDSVAVEQVESAETASDDDETVAAEGDGDVSETDRLPRPAVTWVTDDSRDGRSDMP